MAEYTLLMSFEAIQQEVSTWDVEQIQKLQAVLKGLRRRKEDPEYLAKLAAKIDDRDPRNWVTLEEFEQRLGLSSQAGRECRGS